MGLFNFFSKKEKPMPAISKYNSAEKTVDRYSIPAERIDAMQRIKASDTYCQKIYKRFYKDYPEKPFISQDRELNTDWIEQAEMFPEQSIIPKSMMYRYPDGLLPGHVYMLYWLNKYNNKKVPSYFEYEYGINFKDEKDYLIKNEYLDSSLKPTLKGLEAVKNHIAVIEKRHPSPKYSGNPSITSPIMVSVGRIIPTNLKQGILNVPSSDRTLIDAEFKQINTFIAFALKLAHLKENLNIDTREFSYSDNLTFYKAQPYTQTGRPAKYPLVLQYAYSTHNDLNLARDYFGSLSYTQDGNIGKARLIFWKQKRGYIIHLAMVDNQLTVKKIEKSAPSNWETIYKL